MIPTKARYSIGKYVITQIAWKCPKTGHKILEPSEVDESFKKIAQLKQSFKLTDLPDDYLNLEGRVVRYFVATKRPLVATRDLIAYFSTGNPRSTRALVSRAINRLVKVGIVREVGPAPLDKREKLYAFTGLNEPQRLLRHG